MTNEFMVRIIQGESEKDEARELLHQIYVNEMGWKPWKGNNKSLIDVKNGINGKILTDYFDDYSSIVGVFKNGELVGRMRAIEGGPKSLEISRYTDLTKILPNENLVEFNRLAISSKTNKALALFHILFYCVNFCLEKERLAVVATSFPPFEGVFKSIAFNKISEFYYEPSDLHPSSLLVCKEISKASKLVTNRYNRLIALIASKKRRDIQTP